MDDGDLFFELTGTFCDAGEVAVVIGGLQDGLSPHQIVPRIAQYRMSQAASPATPEQRAYDAQADEISRLQSAVQELTLKADRPDSYWRARLVDAYEYMRSSNGDMDTGYLESLLDPSLPLATSDELNP